MIVWLIFMCICLPSFIPSLVHGSTTSTRYNIVKGYRVEKWILEIRTVNVQSLTQCIAICSEFKDHAICEVVHYNAANSSCVYGRRGGYTLIDGTSADVSVVMEKVAIFYMGNAYTWTFAEAVTRCADAAARLVTYNEMDAEHQVGFDMCGCAWIANGMKYYPIVTPRAGCAFVVDLINCSGQSFAMAACTNRK